MIVKINCCIWELTATDIWKIDFLYETTIIMLSWFYNVGVSINLNIGEYANLKKISWN